MLGRQISYPGPETPLTSLKLKYFTTYWDWRDNYGYLLVHKKHSTPVQGP